MTELSPVPAHVIQEVNEYLRSERSAVEQYSNRELLDDSGRWSLHALARTIYAHGWTEGHLAATEEMRGGRT